MKAKITLIFVLIILLSINATSALQITNVNNDIDDRKNYNKIDINTDEYNREDILHGRTIVNLIEQLDEKLMTKYLENLTDIGPRATGTSGCDEAAEYIYNQFEKMNLPTRYHNWTHDALEGKNVEATLKGTDDTNDEIYIICGHYDSVPESVGADDNGAGVVSVMAAAKVLSQYEFNHTIRFVLFSGEEQGLYGSYNYACDAAKNNDNIAAILNIDMTGYASNIENGNKVSVFRNIRSSWIAELTVEISEQYKNYINLNVILSKMYTPSSDHYGFWQNGYDGILYSENNKNPDYHTPQDNMNTVNITYATKIAKLSLATLSELSEINRPIKGKKLYVGGNGNNNYSKIKHAIENSTNCDKIYVYPGIYNENILIDNSIDLISKEKHNATITNNQPKTILKIKADYSHISGFTIQNSCKTKRGAGIDLHANYCTIINNNISNNTGYGIGLKSAENNNLFFNKINKNTNGIVLWRISPYNNINYNIITKNQESGITLSAKSHFTSIKNNKISYNLYGIYTQPGGKGESYGNPTNNNINNNNITQNKYGIYLNIYSTKNKIISNNINKNQVGIYIGRASRNNKILKNNFIGNKIHATFDSVIFNRWLRNYWSNRKLNFGPKIIKGCIRNIQITPKIIWFNVDLLPKLKPYKFSI